MAPKHTQLRTKTPSTITHELQSMISPAEALRMLKLGNQRFLARHTIQRDLLQQVQDSSAAQYPFAMVLSCIDSRIPTELVFDQGIGDVFNARVAGNVVNTDILGSMEFATKVAGAKLIVVMGHTNCGAIKGACDQVQLGNLSPLLHKLKPAVEATWTPDYAERNSNNASFVDQVALQNVKLSIENIKQQSPLLAEMHQNGEIDLVGAMYDVSTGQVNFI